MTIHYQDDTVTLHHGDALATLADLPDGAANCIVTSPPYFGLRDYQVDSTAWPEVTYAPIAGLPGITIPAMSCALGDEPDPAAFVGHVKLLFTEARRVLAADGTLWLNFGDTYASKARGSDAGWDKSRLTNPGTVQKRQAAALRKTGERHRGKAAGIAEKNLFGIPWRVAFALQADGWILRNDNIWAKPNAMPESVRDRTSSQHEYVFMFAKRGRYWFDRDAIAEPAAGRASGYHEATAAAYAAATGRTKNGGNPGSTLHTTASETRSPRDVWSIPTVPFPGRHYAVMAPDVARRCVAAGCRPGGTVLDPFSGSGTTGMVAVESGRRYVGIDMDAAALDLSLRTRLQQGVLYLGVAG